MKNFIIDTTVPCKGVYLKCRINNYVSGDTVCFKTTYKLLKGLSCHKECEIGGKVMCFTEWFYDSLRDFDMDILSPPDDPQHNQIYKVDIIDHGGGDIDFELQLVK